MKYVLPAQDFQFFESAQGQKLQAFVTSIPTSFWESLGSTPFTYTEPTETSENHQSMLLANFDTIEEINEHEKCLLFAGINTFALQTVDEYKKAVNEAFAVYEGLWDATASLVKTLTEGGTAIGFLHLILDLIGLVPGSWVGFPIDVVANLLNAIIYGARGMWFMAILSAIAAIPANYLFKGLKLTLSPFTKLLNVLGLKIFKADVAAVKIASSELRLAAGLEKSTMLAKGLEGFIGFIKGAFVGILKGIGSMLDMVLRFIPGIPKGKATKIIEEYIEIPLMKAVRGSEEAITILKQGDDVLANATKTEIKDTAVKQGLSKAEQDIVSDKFIKLAKGDADLVAEVTTSQVYKQMVEAGATQAAKDAYVTAALARKSFNKAITSTDKILANPEVADIMIAAGWKADSSVLIKAVNAGDEAVVGKFFKTMTDNPAIVKTMSEGEAALMKAYSKFPQDFIKHGKNFDNYLLTLTRISKKYAYRAKIGKRLLIFVTKQLAKYIMSDKCREQEVNKILSIRSTDDLTELGAKQLIKESESSDRAQVREMIIKKYNLADVQDTSEAKAEIDRLTDEAIAIAKKSAVDECNKEAKLLEAGTGMNTWHNTIPDNDLGAKELTKSDYKILQNSQESILREIGQDVDLTPLHDVSNSSPTVQLYLSDSYDAESGKMVINENEESRLKAAAERLLKKGVIKTEAELNKHVNDVKKHWDEGTEPEEVTKMLDGGGIKESLAINNTRQFMTFEHFKNSTYKR